MPIRIVQVALVALATEVLAVIVLVLVVAAFGPSEANAAQAYAEKMGYWIGPVAGFVFCLAGGWLVASRLSSHQLLNGLAVGTVAASIDVAILVASGAEFQFIFVVSNLGRVVAGSIGGWLGSRSAS